MPRTTREIPLLTDLLFVCTKTPLIIKKCVSVILTVDASSKGKSQSRCKVSLTASMGSTVAEEVIVLLRRLHALPAWNQTISDYITQQLSTVTDILLEEGHAEVSMLKRW